ncbi:hypothetical protein E5163_05545 [Marinicauda algicola]|uniref:Nitrogen fixation protein FixH n=1 Tax=Marinicauda algicola TaxID=2029849 RepID=A0A4S2H4W0_9PROT|nr:FixH family protein [Marinicauda algicola]TGY90583.1 hypothetical protein E5163_05545 [Marinicauda algicola]
MTSDNYIDQREPRFVVRGRHVLFALVGFFAVVIAVNAVFIAFAVKTFSGEEVERSYVQGLEYNRVIEARRAQAELGWQAAVNMTGGQVLVEIARPDGSPVGGLFLEGALRHPADTGLDRPLAFRERETGLYVAEVSDLPEGQWILSAHVDGERPFEMEHRLWHR